MELDLDNAMLQAVRSDEVGWGHLHESVTRGVLRQWDIPCLSARAANELLHEIAPLAERLLAGAEMEPDVSRGSNVAVLDEDAERAEKEIGEVIDSYCGDAELVRAVDAVEWYDIVPEQLTADTTDEQLREIAAAEEERVRQDAVLILDGEERLRAQRDVLRERVAEELSEVADRHRELERRRNALVRRLAGWGESSREIAALVGLSHGGV
ncbi:MULTISPECIES: hypothetical protein [Actinosynnema]|uniref:hypothetical protein n=1 Tax=Actinosynnema TaxID=40566 RepID=UPI0020A3A8F9|nr:hypothetical protein [Actinosynnema pretiosum]MCP2097356.1 hypothetical protein [Actinosynnema pretiosum]